MNPLSVKRMREKYGNEYRLVRKMKKYLQEWIKQTQRKKWKRDEAMLAITEVVMFLNRKVTPMEDSPYVD